MSLSFPDTVHIMYFVRATNPQGLGIRTPRAGNYNFRLSPRPLLGIRVYNDTRGTKGVASTWHRRSQLFKSGGTCDGVEGPPGRIFRKFYFDISERLCTLDS